METVSSFNKVALDKIQVGICPYCLRCGFLNTISHIVQKHRITNIEVRKDFGINYYEPLCTPELSQIYSQRPISKKTLTALKYGRENQPKTHRLFSPQGQISRSRWLFSDRHKKIACQAMSIPEAQANLKEWAKTAYLKRERLSNGQFAGKKAVEV